MSTPGTRFPLFDSLRAVAAVTVLLFHVGFVLEGFQHPTFGRYFAQLNVGVAIFFVISGFLLYRPFAQARFDGARTPAIGRYAIRRAFRILPAFWVALTGAAIWLDDPDVFDRPYVYYTLVQNYDVDTLSRALGHAWTLSVEITFYAFLPLLALALRRVRPSSVRGFVTSEAGVLALMFGTALAWRLTQTQTRNGFIWFTPEVASLPAFLDHFALGMGLAVASVALAGRARQPALVRLVERAPWALWGGAVALYLVMCNVGGGFADAHGETTRHLLRGAIAVLLLAPAIFGHELRDRVRSVLAWRPLLWLGVISYSLYLWHPVVARKIGGTSLDENFGWVPSAGAQVAASVAVAAVSYYLVERPAVRLSKRLVSGRGRKGPPAGAEAGLGSPADAR
ncbi:MAG TPA: acyltransferase [Thermoleophilaceae bacterium]